MKKYKIINQRVEVKGKTREIGEILAASEFKKGEVESLIASKHISEVKK